MTWSAYLRTLHPPLSRHYHSYPPLQSDYLQLITVPSTHGPTPPPILGPLPAQTPNTTSLPNPTQQHPQRPPTPPNAHALRLRQQGRQADPPTRGYETALHTAPHRTANSSSSSSLVNSGGYTDNRDPIPHSPPPNHNLLGGYLDGPASGNRPNHSSTTSQPTLFTNRDYVPDTRAVHRSHSPTLSAPHHITSLTQHRPTTHPNRGHRSSPIRHNTPPTDNSTSHTKRRRQHSPPHGKISHRDHTTSTNGDRTGKPWCNCCTAQLSDDDTSSPASRDNDDFDIRYRVRPSTNHRPSHSTLHQHLLSILRDNAHYHDKQRRELERRISRQGMPTYYTSSTTTFHNTKEYTNLAETLSSAQYSRYRARGGTLPRNHHTDDFRYNSPNHRNMQPGQRYRTWFHRAFGREHYSLGEANTAYNAWLNEHASIPKPPRGTSPTRSRPPSPSHNPYLPLAHYHSSPAPDSRSDTDSPFIYSPPDPPPAAYNAHPHEDNSQATITPPPPTSIPPIRPYDTDESQSSSDSDPQPRDIRTQTHVLNISPDDPNAVVDSGAMMTTVPRRLLLGTPWEDNIRPAPPGTTIRYGNMETEPVEEHAQIGQYNTSLVPDRFSTALVCVHDIVTAGHTVTFTDHHTIISDIGSSYTLTTPRQPASREWRVPLYILQRLTDLRAAHPLRNARSHEPDHRPN